MAEFTFAPLTPASFLDRAAAVFADRTAIIDGERRFTYRELSDRCRQLAGALAATGAGREDRVAALCANSHVMLELPQDEQATLRARQGAPNIIARPLRVLDEEGRDVPADGETIGEIPVSGNDVMLGYYRDDQATREVTRSGCFLTGDLAVMHPDGYVEIRDRSKDIIISGGENIASVEVEQVLDSHPSVVESAVVGMPHERWGEVPVAFVALRKDDVDAGALTEYARERLARYKVPKRFEFGKLPKTSTGKIQKTVLRDRANELEESS